MFYMSVFWEKFFFIFTFFTQGSSYLSANAYGIMHRMHHAYADTEEDPHSPTYDKTLIAMMNRTKNNYMAIFDRTIKIDEQFTKGVPEWFAFEKIAHSIPVRLLWIAAYIAFYVHFATEWWMFLFLPIHILSGPIHGAIINWFAHKYGYTNFNVGNTSKNFLPLDVLMLGECYHNNHHKNSNNPNFGHKWFEIDLTYLIIRQLDRTGIIKLKF